LFLSKNGKGKFSVTNGGLFMFEGSFFDDSSPQVFYALHDKKGRGINFNDFGFDF
jgi:hypothetical protein